MREEDLRRLAELMTELQPNPAPAPVNAFWQVLAAFAAGVLVNTATGWLERWRLQREARKRERVGLYLALRHYQRTIDSAEEDSSMDYARMDVETALASEVNVKYADSIREVALEGFHPFLGMQKRKAFDEIVREVRRETLSFSERLKAEEPGFRGGALTRRARRVEQFLGRRTEEDGLLVRVALRLERLL